ncbi:MAG: hypothetical protein LHW55_02745, partial [Candidatus Cloacimonetes bacterium]|nr:hypothetical protein [Candidatus Cloacimonadota bacterium]
MNTEYEAINSSTRGYQGVSFPDAEFEEYLRGPVKNKLNDQETNKDLLDILDVIKSDTGFKSDILLADIQSLVGSRASFRTWEIGEAFAEEVLSNEFQCRFYWNARRDSRNPNENRAGADLVGFIESQNEVYFLFGEVKTSSEDRKPPTVMKSMESQLKQLAESQKVRLNLIKYLCSKKESLSDGSSFKTDFNRAIRSYYKDEKMQLMGVLVRDTEVDKKDISGSYNFLDKLVKDSYGIRLVAMYVSVPEQKWSTIMN